ncbi:MAG: AAA family ATPase [Maribacter sp.]
MNTKRIVITGGPSTGKTAVIEILEQKGYQCLEEVIRAMTLAEKEAENDVVFKSNPIVSVSDPMAFNQMILDARIDQYNSTLESSDELIFFDRGIPDVLAYMDCFQQEYEQSFTDACASHRYDLVFLMPPWKEIHVVDNERFESFDESLRIHKCLANSYSKLGYNVQIVPKDTILNRVNFILNNIKNIK